MQDVAGEDRIRRIGLGIDCRAPRGDGVSLVGPQTRETEMELDERALGVEDAELLQPVERPDRPRRERRAHLRLERPMAREERLGRGKPARCVERFRPPQVACLRVGAEPERERERRPARAGGRDRGRRPRRAVSCGHDRDRGDARRGSRSERGEEHDPATRAHIRRR